MREDQSPTLLLKLCTIVAQQTEILTAIEHLAESLRENEVRVRALEVWTDMQRGRHLPEP